MTQLILYSFISGFALLGGALFGITFKLKQKTIAGIMAFGAGVLICALTFGLMEESFQHGGFDAVIIGFLTGGVTFIVIDYLLHRFGGRRHRYHQPYGQQPESSGSMIIIGSVLDGVPESIALGLALASGHSQGLLIAVAILLSNFPESIASLTGLKKEGFNNRKICWLWFGVSMIVTGTVMISYVLLKDISPNNIGVIEAFAAGSMLAMLASNMMPEAYEDGGYSVGLPTVLGFLVAFIVSRY